MCCILLSQPVELQGYTHRMSTDSTHMREICKTHRRVHEQEPSSGKQRVCVVLWSHSSCYLHGKKCLKGSVTT